MPWWDRDPGIARAREAAANAHNRLDELQRRIAWLERQQRSSPDQHPGFTRADGARVQKVVEGPVVEHYIAPQVRQWNVTDPDTQGYDVQAALCYFKGRRVRIVVGDLGPI